MLRFFTLPLWFFTSLLLMAGRVAPTPAQRLVAAAKARTRCQVTYDARYFVIPYPNGDVPQHLGVCADVVIRTYRTALGIDLQRLVHEDMRQHFAAYPKRWGLKKPDKNIDHRRVLNLKTFFQRQGASLPVTKSPKDYLPGDLVTCDVLVDGQLLPHIGIVIDRKNKKGAPLIVHNIGQGPKTEDCLFTYPLTGHYRYLPQAPPAAN